MKKSEKLIEYFEKRHRGTEQQIRNTGLYLVEAAKELNRLLKSKKYTAEDLLDGVIVSKITSYHKEAWKDNETFKHLTFKKYLEWIELDVSKLEKLEQQFNTWKSQEITFHIHNDIFWDWCKSYDKVLHDKLAPDTVTYKYSELLDIGKNSVKENLSKGYYCLYLENDEQLEMINRIKETVSLVKSIGVKEYDLRYGDKRDTTREHIMQLLHPYIKDINFELDVDSLKINFYEIIRRIR